MGAAAARRENAIARRHETRARSGGGAARSGGGAVRRQRDACVLGSWASDREGLDAAPPLRPLSFTVATRRRREERSLDATRVCHARRERHAGRTRGVTPRDGDRKRRRIEDRRSIGRRRLIEDRRSIGRRRSIGHLSIGHLRSMEDLRPNELPHTHEQVEQGRQRDEDRDDDEREDGLRERSHSSAQRRAARRRVPWSFVVEERERRRRGGTPLLPARARV